MQAPPSLVDVATVSATRSELAHRRHGKAHERVVMLGQHLAAAFEELYSAGQALQAEHGIEVSSTFTHPLSEAWFDWRAKRQLKDMDARR
jgi:hypothetical protein